MDLLKVTSSGLYCEQGDFFIDPVKGVDRAVLTHAHADHARWGSRHYLAQQLNKEILKLRLGNDINLSLLDYNEVQRINGVKVSFHPAGHIWGSSQVRLEYKGEVWVVSGDYKTESDGFSGSFEPVTCNTFITESTFALPVFKWKPQHLVMNEINKWWRNNQDEGKVSILCAYALGKAQRLLTSLDLSIGRVFVHGAVANVNEALQKDGAVLPEATYVTSNSPKQELNGGLVIAPGSAIGTSWMRKFQPYEVANASGWMQIRGIKKRRNQGHGFVISDHADWDGLNKAVKETGAERVLVTHGYTEVFSKWLSDQGLASNTIEIPRETDSL